MRDEAVCTQKVIAQVFIRLYSIRLEVKDQIWYGI